MDKRKKEEYKTLSLGLKRQVYEDLVRQIRLRESRELRKIAVSDAIRESMLRNGYVI